jgi:hypothetical protein
LKIWRTKNICGCRKYKENNCRKYIADDKTRKLEEIWMNEKDIEKREQAMTELFLKEGNENKEIYRVVQKSFDIRSLITERPRREILAQPCIDSF